VTRIALYSHDALGLGHVARSLALARALGERVPRPEILVLSGAREAAMLRRPPGCDVLGLPGLVRPGRERYAALDLLGVAAPERRALRAAVAAAALTSFAPDLLVVDRHPRGACGELEASLRALAGRSTIVLGLRDVLDHPTVASHEWSAHRAEEALDAWYDAVWVYGDRRVYDVTADIDLPARLRRAVHFTGYLVPGRDAGRAPAGSGRTVLGLVGGGADGAELARALLTSAPLHGLPTEVVLGPQMPPDDRAELHALAKGLRSARVHDFVPDVSALLDRATAVVSMAGYNTVCEVLARGRPVLMVPRTRPRRDQLVRASRLDEQGLVTMLHPDELSPAAVASWVCGATGRASGAPPQGVRLDGLARVQALAGEVLARRDAVHVAV
jgi:predicted glycosyltransferase